MKDLKKKVLLYAGIVAAFLVVSYGFVPEVLGGKIVNQSDITGYVGMAHEANTWDAEHPDDKTAWTNSMFGGMPTTMLTGNNGGDATQGLFDAFLTGKRPASYFFISLLGAFLLMLALGVSPLLAAAGAVAVTFCSYNLQIIQVGHNAKMLALAWAPWVLAGVFYTYRKTLETGKISLVGPVLTAFALSFQIKANHVQISYYIALIIASYFIVNLITIGIKEREKLKPFLITTGLLIVFAAVGIGTNANRLVPTWEYTQETMRGGSELTRDDGAQKSKGLNFEYATQWSYGLEELPNIMIANYNGGSSSGAVDPKTSEMAKLLLKAGYKQKEVENITKALPMYWGPQPFTAGPMYIGAITVFLFLLGLCLPKCKEKWWIIIPSVLGVLLAMGGAYGGTTLIAKLVRAFNVFWFESTPFYSKFRTVSMALVILQFTMPILAFTALSKVLSGQFERKRLITALAISTGIAGIFCLLIWIFPGLVGSFTGPEDAQYDDILRDTFIADRISLMKADAFTALVLVLATGGLLFWSMVPGTKPSKLSADKRRIVAAAGICLLVCINLFSVGKRYLNSSHFVTKSKFDSHFTLRPADKSILADKTLSYRVLDLTKNVFNEATPSYWHKNIGGYSPVKLQRYQDLIDNYLTGEIKDIYGSLSGVKTITEAQANLPALPVLSALNCKYIIIDGNVAPAVNSKALGPVWFVDDIVGTASANEEIALLGAIPLDKVAVVREAQSVTSFEAATAEDSIALTEYAPNQLKYSYKTSGQRLAVFSEIWCSYGWKAWTEDAAGNKTGDLDLLRTDWTLRGAVIPQGEGFVVMRFQPDSYAKGRTLSAVCSWVLILMLIGTAVLPKSKQLRELLSQAKGRNLQG